MRKSKFGWLILLVLSCTHGKNNTEYISFFSKRDSFKHNDKKHIDQIISFQKNEKSKIESIKITSWVGGSIEDKFYPSFNIIGKCIEKENSLYYVHNKDTSELFRFEKSNFENELIMISSVSGNSLGSDTLHKTVMIALDTVYNNEDESTYKLSVTGVSPYTPINEGVTLYFYIKKTIGVIGVVAKFDGEHGFYFFMKGEVIDSLLVKSNYKTKFKIE